MASRRECVRSVRCFSVVVPAGGNKCCPWFLEGGSVIQGIQEMMLKPRGQLLSRRIDGPLFHPFPAYILEISQIILGARGLFPGEHGSYLSQKMGWLSLLAA